MSQDQPKSYLKLGVVVLSLLFLVLLSVLIFPRSKQYKPLISPGFLQGFNLSSTFSFAFKSQGLSNIVGDNLAGKEGEYAVYIEDLNDGENYGLKALDTFPAASLYKLYLIAAVLKEVEKSQPVIASPEGARQSQDKEIASSKTPRNDVSRLTMKTKLTASKSHLIEVYGGVDFGYEEIPEDDVIEYSVEEALTRVGRISDNFAAIMLMDKVGPDKVQVVVDSIGATSTSIKSPSTTSAEDIGKLFKALFKKELISPFVSLKVIEFLSLNQLNNRIPAFAGASAGKPALEGVRIIHKTGELPGVRHDAGIVWLPEPTSRESPSTGSTTLTTGTLGTSEPTPEVSANGNTPEVTGTGSPGVGERAYVIVLMSKDLTYEDEGVETLAKISKDVYEYFTQKNIHKATP